MTVIWPDVRGKYWPYVGMAVACPTCNVGPGEPCKACPAGAHHRLRDDIAESMGFRFLAPPGLLEPLE